MRSAKFHYIKAVNVLCFGPEGIEVHFDDYGQVVQVIGINLDYPGTEEEPASNAAGKSSVQELLSIGLYGKTVKNPTKNKGSQIVNVKADKGVVEVQWDDFRLVRSFKRNKTGTVNGTLQLWQSKDRIWDDKTEITQNCGPLENKIEQEIGLSHHAFCNVVIFDDSNTYSFLEADSKKKREIVENLLDLEQYRGYHENCKSIVKDLKTKIDGLTREYAHLQTEVDAATRRIASVREQEVQWKAQKKRGIDELAKRIEAKQKQLESSDSGAALSAWQQAQDRLVKLNDEIADLEAKRKKVEEAIDSARGKLDKAREDKAAMEDAIRVQQALIKDINAELQKSLKLASSLENFEDGTPCPYCYGTINRDNYGEALINARHTADECRDKIAKETAALTADQERYAAKVASIKNMETKIAEAAGKQQAVAKKIKADRDEMTMILQLPKPDGTAAEQVLEVEIVELKKQLKTMTDECDGQSPYTEIIAQAETEKTQKEAEKDQKGAELQGTEGEMPYYQFWLEAFGDNGIRKFVIDGIIPALNDRIAYWLDILIEGKVELTFDNMLEQKITRCGNDATYHNTSNGERRRINLAVSQAFAYVMMLNSGTCPSIVFLDEITGGGIDKAGVPGVYNMIFELAKERQVFVTTHNETLMGLLQGCETITLKKRDDITVLVS